MRYSKTVLTEACDHRQHQLQNCSAVETSFEESFDLGFVDDRWRFDEKRAETRIVFENISDFDPVFWKNHLLLISFARRSQSHQKISPICYEHFKDLFEDTHGAKFCLNTILLLLEYITLYIYRRLDYVQRQSLVLYCKGNFWILHMIKGNYKTNSDKKIVFELT